MYDIYGIWLSMKGRCYSSNNPAYIDCSICNQWLTGFETFRSWYLDNLYDCNGEMLEIDKDLFSKGEKIYSPETCCLLPKRINLLISFKKSKKSGLPAGVNQGASGSYIATLHRGSGHLSKSFKSLDEAFDYYRTNKERHIREAAELYKIYLPERIYEALINYKVTKE